MWVRTIGVVNLFWGPAAWGDGLPRVRGGRGWRKEAVMGPVIVPTRPPPTGGGVRKMKIKSLTEGTLPGWALTPGHGTPLLSLDLRRV